MKPIVTAACLAAICCFGLNGCVLAAVGAAGAGGYLAANSHTLSEDDSDRPAPRADNPPPPPYRPAPPAPPQSLAPPPPPSPPYQSAPIEAVPLN